MTLAVHAPTDAQLAYIAALCRDRGWQYPDAVASKDEASAIITAMTNGTYRPQDFAYPWRDVNATVSFGGSVYLEADSAEEALKAAMDMRAGDFDYDTDAGEVEFNVDPTVEPDRHA